MADEATTAQLHEACAAVQALLDSIRDKVEHVDPDS